MNKRIETVSTSTEQIKNINFHRMTKKYDAVLHLFTFFWPILFEFSAANSPIHTLNYYRHVSSLSSKLLFLPIQHSLQVMNIPTNIQTMMNVAWTAINLLAQINRMWNGFTFGNHCADHGLVPFSLFFVHFIFGGKFQGRNGTIFRITHKYTEHTH